MKVLSASCCSSVMKLALSAAVNLECETNLCIIEWPGSSSRRLIVERLLWNRLIFPYGFFCLDMKVKNFVEVYINIGYI